MGRRSPQVGMNDFVIVIGFFLLTLLAPACVGGCRGGWVFGSGAARRTRGVWQNLDWVILLVAAMVLAALYRRPLA